MCNGKRFVDELVFVDSSLNTTIISKIDFSSITGGRGFSDLLSYSLFSLNEYGNNELIENRTYTNFDFLKEYSEIGVRMEDLVGNKFKWIEFFGLDIPVDFMDLVSLDLRIHSFIDGLADKWQYNTGECDTFSEFDLMILKTMMNELLMSRFNKNYHLYLFNTKDIEALIKLLRDPELLFGDLEKSFKYELLAVLYELLLIHK